MPETLVDPAPVTEATPDVVAGADLIPEAPTPETPADVVSEPAEAAVEDGAESDVTPEEVEAREVLRKDQLLRSDIKRVAAGFISTSHDLYAGGRNVAVRPKKAYQTLKRNGASKKYERREAKRNTSMFKFMNRHYDRAANEAKKNLDWREANLADTTGAMDTRAASASTRRGERLEAIEAKKQYLIEGKIYAQERKIMRRERAARRRALHRSAEAGGGMSHSERQRRIDTFTDEDRRRIRQLAIVAAKAKRAKSASSE